MRVSTQRKLMQFGFYISGLGLIWYGALFDKTLFTPTFGTILALLFICAGFLSSGRSSNNTRQTPKDRDHASNHEDDSGHRDDDDDIDPLVKKVRDVVRRHLDRSQLAPI